MFAPLHFGSRTTVAALILAGGIILLHSLSFQERVPLRAPLQDFPAVFAAWHGQDEPLPEDTVKAVAVDEYLNRNYIASSPEPVHLYIGYYQSQRQGDTIHSPKNCLPGSGWNAVTSGRVSFNTTAGPVDVNEYVVEKGLQQELVLYWYQSRGRVIASEYSAKIWMVFDALTRDRTDGAIVRINTPIRSNVADAQTRAVAFAQAIYPHLGEFVPN